MATTTEQPPQEKENPREHDRDQNQTDDRKPEQKPQRPWYREHPLGALAAAILVVVALIGAFFWWRYMETYESTDDAFIDGHISSVSARVQGTVHAVYVVENQQVVAGQTLVDLDPRDLKVSL